ncbi:hypothetical protein NDU88_011755 [Pleurodeles waltl]|uniref:Uncharacterized protein n=1 Tax=Pleurodeles waltl TaxID=8319 RepID=A0AAV7QY91_PLEWA|nr:hypothetical protein NDU88_011755 [Pleurodeles waltl]
MVGRKQGNPTQQKKRIDTTRHRTQAETNEEPTRGEEKRTTSGKKAAAGTGPWPTIPKSRSPERRSLPCAENHRIAGPKQRRRASARQPRHTSNQDPPSGHIEASRSATPESPAGWKVADPDTASRPSPAGTIPSCPRPVGRQEKEQAECWILGLHSVLRTSRSLRFANPT